MLFCSGSGMGAMARDKGIMTPGTKNMRGRPLHQWNPSTEPLGFHTQNLNPTHVKSLMKEILTRREVMLYQQSEKYCNRTCVCDTIGYELVNADGKLIRAVL